MFDDVNKQGAQTAPGGASQEPIDIFSEADASVPAAGDIMEEGVKTKGFPVKIVAIVAGAVVVLGLGGLGIYQFVLKKPAQAPVQEFTPEEPPVDFGGEAPLEDEGGGEKLPEEILTPTPTGEVPPGQPTEAIPEAPSAASPAQPGVPTPSPLAQPSVNVQVTPPTDSDGDGLSDDEEGRYGTDKNVVDTDNDGLSDREEIQVYTSNPLNPDSDGDGFSDGTEVKNGYNPSGSGKLITVPVGQQAPSPVQP
ncbi:hypothetical protein HYW94_04570 [Candidatus Uhrbacteria bacterium]|nr:hypothetical protein [Candidatus Uhrbacteria bacterium]